jgi:hypothetical protein
MPKYAQSQYRVKNPEKYIGNKTPYFRSSWEFAFMRFCDEHSSVLKWANEAIKIPYRNPFTGKYTVYVPDFFISYIDGNNKQHNELIEVKPLNQTSVKEAKNNRLNRAHAALNEAKWAAAELWCKQNNVVFRVVSENDIFSGTKGNSKRR